MKINHHVFMVKFFVEEHSVRTLTSVTGIKRGAYNYFEKIYPQIFSKPTKRKHKKWRRYSAVDLVLYSILKDLRNFQIGHQTIVEILSLSQCALMTDSCFSKILNNESEVVILNGIKETNLIEIPVAAEKSKILKQFLIPNRPYVYVKINPYFNFVLKKLRIKKPL